MSAKKKRIFADAIIVLCLTVGLVITASVIYEYHRLDTPMPAAVLAVLIGLWGGELLIIAMRQILGPDIVTQIKTKKTDTGGVTSI